MAILARWSELHVGLAEVWSGNTGRRRAGGLSVYSGQGPGVSAASLESVSGNQKPQVAGSPGDSGLAGVQSANLPRPADAGGQEFRQQHWRSAPASGQCQAVFLPLSCSGPWPLACEPPLKRGAEGPGGHLPTTPTPLGSLLAPDSRGERGSPSLSAGSTGGP